MNKLHVVGLFLLFLFGCLANQQTDPAPQNSNPSTPTLSDEIEKCGELYEDGDVNCYTILAVEHNNPGICKMYDYGSDENDCITALAVKYNKPEYCELAPLDFECYEKFEKDE